MNIPPAQALGHAANMLLPGAGNTLQNELDTERLLKQKKTLDTQALGSGSAAQSLLGITGGIMGQL